MKNKDKYLNVKWIFCAYYYHNHNLPYCSEVFDFLIISIRKGLLLSLVTSLTGVSTSPNSIRADRAASVSLNWDLDTAVSLAPSPEWDLF